MPIIRILKDFPQNLSQVLGKAAEKGSNGRFFVKLRAGSKG
jgi:hypothetical protein